MRLDVVHDMSLADQARESIRRAILDGSLHPEERLTIEQLAVELGVSRTPVREALKALEGDGLVRLLPHRGVVVEPFAREELYHRYSIRAMLEGYAAELACRADAALIAGELEMNCDRLEAVALRVDGDQLEQTRRLAELNQEFHAIIHEGSRSRTLVRLLGTLRNPLAFTLWYWQDPVRRRSSLEIHRQIAGAFRGNRPGVARRLTERHLLDARDLLMESGDDPGRRAGV
jgi:GntR family transcriptional regulator, vanillate catabolism transcriptional regulator